MSDFFISTLSQVEWKPCCATKTRGKSKRNYCPQSGRSHPQIPSQVRRVHLSSALQLTGFVELVRRLRALTLRLLPHEVNVKTINDPANRIITPRVILTYREAAGDFADAVGLPLGKLVIEYEFFNQLPYCLLRAHSKFLHDGQRNPASHGENLGRGMCLNQHTLGQLI